MINFSDCSYHKQFQFRRGEAYLQFDNVIFQGDDSDDDMDENRDFPVKEQAYPGRKPMIIDVVCLVMEYLQVQNLVLVHVLLWFLAR